MMTGMPHTQAAGKAVACLYLATPTSDICNHAAAEWALHAPPARNVAARQLLCGHPQVYFLRKGRSDIELTVANVPNLYPAQTPRRSIERRFTIHHTAPRIHNCTSLVYDTSHHCYTRLVRLWRRISFGKCCVKSRKGGIVFEPCSVTRYTINSRRRSSHVRRRE